MASTGPLRRDILASLNELFKSFKHPYALIGGVAVLLHGFVRHTDDIDLMVYCSTQDFARLHMYANAQGFRASQSRTGNMLVMTHKASGAQVEILRATSPAEKRGIQRAKSTNVLGTTFQVMTVEDIIILKIETVTKNPSRKTRDWPDVAGLLGILKYPQDFNRVVSYVDSKGIPSVARKSWKAYVNAVRTLHDK